MRLFIATKPDTIRPKHGYFVEVDMLPSIAERPGVFIDQRLFNAVQIYPVNGHVDNDLVIVSILVPGDYGADLLEMDSSHFEFRVFATLDEIRAAYPQTDTTIDKEITDDEGQAQTIQVPVCNWDQTWG